MMCENTVDSILSLFLFQLNDKLRDVLETLATTHADELERLKDSPPGKAAINSSRVDEDPDALDLSSLSTGVFTLGL